MRVIPPNNFPIQYQGRISDGRTPTYSQVDLYVQHEFKLGGNKRLMIDANVLNLFDQDTARNRFLDELESGAGIRNTEAQFFRGFDAQALAAAQGIKRDPRFLMDSEFQGRREVQQRLSAIAGTITASAVVSRARLRIDCYLLDRVPYAASGSQARS